MITITVSGHELVLFKDTTLNIEYNNSIFAKDAIEGDITYTFDIPVNGNELALSFVHLPYVSSHRKYDCTINFNGINIVTGKLFVQKVTSKRYSVGVLVNPYPDGWTRQSVREDYNDEVVIATSYPTYRNEWKNFLKKTADENSDVKFGVFANEENYGSGNEDFGKWMGSNLDRIVNRLFFNTSGNVVEAHDHPLIRIFNQRNKIGDEDVEMNQFAFCPQIRLSSVLRKVISSSGYRVGGSFFEDEILRKIFIQSMVALDGDVFQYLDSSNILLAATYEAYEDPRFLYPVYVWRDTYGYWYYDHEGMEAWATGFGRIYDQKRISEYPLWGIYNRDFGCIPFRQIKGEYITCNYGNIVFGAEGQYYITGRIDFPRFVSNGFDKEIPVKIRLRNGQGVIVFERPYNISEGNWSIMFEDEIFVSGGDVGESYRMSAEIEPEGLPKAIPAKGRIDITFKNFTESPMLNIFSKTYCENQCLPDIENNKFINEIRKSIGLTFYVDYRSKRIEVDTVADIMGAKSLNLSDYVMTNETELNIEDKAASFAFGQLKSQNDIPDNKMIEDVVEVADLPPAEQNIGRICFVKGMNQYYISEKEGDAESNWTYVWKTYCGNTRKITVGEYKMEDISSSVVIPMMREYSVNNSFGDQGPIPDIPDSMESVMFNSKTSDKIILLYYRGQAILQTRERKFRYDRMAPYAPDEFSLSPDSMGTKYTKPWLHLYASKRTITYKFRMPIAVALQTIALLQPQNVSTSNQVRWIMVDNVRSMPRKISFQIDNNSSDVLCEIEAAKMD